MKIVHINMTHNGSTGKIMLGIAKCIRESGDEARTFSPRYYVRGRKEEFPDIEGHKYFGYTFENMLHWRLAQFTGLQGYGSVMGTRQLLREIDQIKPDIIHLHNLHNRTVNLPMLFRYIKRNNIKTVWTLHDCWTMTGKCPYFSLAGCDKWKSGCYKCPQLSIYPSSFVDSTKRMWTNKKKWFSDIKDLTIVTPSEWLGDIVKQSYLGGYPSLVINNGIDLDVFKYYEDNVKESLISTSEKIGRCSDKIVLAVSSGWSKRKGFDYLIEIAKKLKKDYQLVVVGINDGMAKQLPSDVICLSDVSNQTELAKVYSATDVFINPTMEEAFGLVNLEALACGVPVVTFRSGGSPECIDKQSGMVVEQGDVDGMLHAIEELCSRHHEENYNGAINRAKQFDERKLYEKYLEWYGCLVHN